MLPDSPAVTHRHLKTRNEKMQPGVITSFTTVAHPPAGFPHRPRTIGLIELEDGSSVLGEMIVPEGLSLAIGQKVLPRMRLSRVNDDGLRIYDIAYEVAVMKPIEEQIFPGYILALTGPSGVGKSTVSFLLQKVASDYMQKVPIVTTRKRKKGDDGEYRYVTQKVFEELQQQKEIVSFTEIPSSSELRWYGYCKSDIEAIWNKGMIPVVVTEMHLLQGLAEFYGRRSILSCGLLPPGKSKRSMISSLLHRLRIRGRETEEQIQDRLKNAEKDLAFFKEQEHLFDHLIVNENLETVIEKILGLKPPLVPNQPHGK